MRVRGLRLLREQAVRAGQYRRENNEQVQETILHVESPLDPFSHGYSLGRTFFSDHTHKFSEKSLKSDRVGLSTRTKIFLSPFHVDV